MNKMVAKMMTIETEELMCITSLQIAEQTGKTHSNVLVDIRKMLIGLELAELKFQSGYLDKNNQERNMFILPEREAMILASGYDVKLRAMIVDAFLLPAQPLLPATYVDALKALVIAEEEKQIAIADKKFMVDKVLEAVSDRDVAKKEIVDRDSALDFMFDDDKGLSIKEWAQSIYDKEGLKVGQNRLFDILRTLGYLTQRDNSPYQRYQDQRLFTVQTYSVMISNREVPKTRPLVTPKGMEKLTSEVIDYFNEYMR